MAVGRERGGARPRDALVVACAMVCAARACGAGGSADELALGGWRARNRTTSAALDWPTAGRQCNASTRAGALGSVGALLFGARRFAYTPVRAGPAGAPAAPAATDGVASVVALLIEYRASSGTVQGFRQRLPGWHERLLGPHGLTLLLMLGPRTGVRDIAGVVDFAARLGLARTPCAGADAARACAALLGVDRGYVHFALRTAGAPSASSVLVGSVDVPLPRWALGVRAAKLDRWRTPMCNRANFAYVLSTAFYVHDMMRLRVLDYFEYAFKIDTDVAFIAQLPRVGGRTLGEQASAAGALFVKTSDDGMRDDANCTGNLNDFVETYLRAEGARCGVGRVRAAGERAREWGDATVMAYGNFV
ncbi:hypothetical protein KFE25_012629, partial [Diacronema lutheri]